MRDGWQAPLTALVVVILFAAFNAKPIQSAADIAAWVQGVGSLVAIIAAVWIYAKQYQDKKNDALAETSAFVQSIHTEISTLWKGYSTNLRAHITGLADGGFLELVAPLSPDAFVIYNKACEQVGKIDNADLRILIVQTYARFRGFIYSLQLNNGLVIDIAQFEIMYNAADREKRLEQKRDVLRDYGLKLKRADADIEKLMTRLLPLMEQWLADQPLR
jgi:hypothetical protein